MRKNSPPNPLSCQERGTSYATTHEWWSTGECVKNLDILCFWEYRFRMSLTMVISAIIALTCAIALFGLGISELIADRVAKKLHR